SSQQDLSTCRNAGIAYFQRSFGTGCRPTTNSPCIMDDCRVWASTHRPWLPGQGNAHMRHPHIHAVLAGVLATLLAGCAGESPPDSMAGIHPDGAAQEIGRASCRERVWVG